MREYFAYNYNRIKLSRESLMLKKLLIVLLVLSFSFLAFALDDQGNPNDPHTNDRANACYEDGSMAGKCDTDWEWEAGWYLIRFEAGMISREDFPAQYAILLPPLPGETNSHTFVGCQSSPAGYVNFGSSNYLPSGRPQYSDPSCTTDLSSPTLVPLVYAPSGATEAGNICTAHGKLPGGLISGSIYHCS
jgi:hypothetical protein